MMRVSDVMTVDVAAVHAELPISQAAHQLSERGISGMPVIADDGQVIGVVSEADILAKERRGPDGEHGAVARLLHPGPSAESVKHDARLVGDAMTAPAVTIAPYASVATAADRMLERGVNRLPVVAGGRLVGIVTRADLVRAFARSDAQIAAEAREQVSLQQALAGDVGVVNVVVDGGDAVLTGQVRRQSDADVLPRLVRLVPGVVEVRSELSWSEPD